MHCSGSGRVDYLCMERDGRTTAWLRDEDDTWFDAGQIKFTEDLDRANFRFADADGELLINPNHLPPLPPMPLLTILTVFRRRAGGPYLDRQVLRKRKGLLQPPAGRGKRAREPRRQPLRMGQDDRGVPRVLSRS